MYQVTEEYLTSILDALKRLPVESKDFDAADLWVGLYMAIAKIRENPVAEPAKEENKEEE